MIKLLLSFGLLVLGASLGIKYSQKYAEKCEFYKSLCDFNEEFYSEIAFYKRGLLKLADHTYMSSAFNDLLKRYFLPSKKDLIFPHFLTEYQKNDLNVYFYKLGTSDFETQLEIYKTFKKKFEFEKDKAYDEQKKYSSVVKKTGLIVGLIGFIIAL